MDYYKLTSWEANVIQVGLDHIKEEFTILNEEQIETAQGIVNDLTTYVEKNPKDHTPKEMKKFIDGFGLYHYEKILVTMAMTEIYIMHIDLLCDETISNDDEKFSKEVVDACKSIFNKLLVS
tara:strand:+ start:3309 stop:3674 length:366 start_codon:yes stop_codon:yes gene_type:complete